MGAVRTLRVLVLVVAAAGCSSSSPGDAGIDTPPVATFTPFASVTWSLAMTGGRAQLSITDGAGAAACALSTDQQHSLGAAGVQIILQLADPVTEPCPNGHFTVMANCASIGTAAYVPAGCAFYRQFDAQGKTLGIVAAINGEVTFSGDATACSIRPNVGFLGGSFSETLTLRDGAAAQPWCGT